MQWAQGPNVLAARQVVGARRRVIKSLLDVTGCKFDEEALRESEETRRQLTTSS